MRALAEGAPAWGDKFKSMLSDPHLYYEVWDAIKESIDSYARISKKRYTIHIHKPGDYFKNTYDKI